MENLKVGDYAVNVKDKNLYVTIGKKYPIIALNKSNVVILDDEGNFTAISKRSHNIEWRFEPNPIRSNETTTTIEVPCKVLVTFEKTEIENGEQFFIRKVEQINFPEFRKEIESEIERHFSDEMADKVLFTWE